VPTPSGNLGLIGYCGDVSRETAENQLKGLSTGIFKEKGSQQILGTFLLRWSINMTSYVLSYVNKSGSISHIAYIHIGMAFSFMAKVVRPKRRKGSSFQRGSERGQSLCFKPASFLKG
jgi:hypothetical protein